MNILFLSRWFPVPSDNGAKLRIYNLLRGLMSMHGVYLLSFADDLAGAKAADTTSICRSARVVQWNEFQPNSPQALLGLLHPAPRSLLDTYSTEMEGEIRQALASSPIDLVILSQWQMTVYRHLFAGLPILFEEIEVGVPYGQFRNATGFHRFRAGLTWLKQRHFLSKVLAEGHPCTVVSEQEQVLLRSIAPSSPIHVIPNGVSIENYDRIQENPIPGTLIFTGSFRYRPNYEAMVWFVEQVFPLIQEEMPETQLTITGDSAGLTISDCAGVVQTGFVAEVHPLVARSWVSVVPLQVGGGTRLKILEAMALGTPIVSTSKGAEGLAVQADRHLLIADTPESFAKKTLLLLRNAALRKSLADQAYQLVCERYDWRVILPELLSLVEQIGLSSAQNPRSSDNRKR